MDVRKSFTLGEILIALVVIGVIAILTIPSLMKNTNEKALMTKLQTVIADLNSMVAKEILVSRTNVIENTGICQNPQAFLEQFDYVLGKEGFADTYYNLEGEEYDEVSIPDNRVLLKNGAGIGIINEYTSEPNTSAIVIDVNGPEKPNTIGVDYFIAALYQDDYEENGFHIGDIGGYINGDGDGEETIDSLRTGCRGSNAASCYRLAELNSFDPDYLNR